MSKLIFTGDIQIGKSTVIKKIINKYIKHNEIKDLKLSGFISFKDESENVYMCIFDNLNINSSINEIYSYIKDNSEAIHIAYMGPNHKEVIGESFVKAADAIKALKLGSSDILLLDELGYLEKTCDKFINAVFDVINKSENVLISMRGSRNEHYLNRLSDMDIPVITVNLENRNELPGKLYI